MELCVYTHGVLFKLLSSLLEHSNPEDVECDATHPEERDPICIQSIYVYNTFASVKNYIHFMAHQ